MRAFKYQLMLICRHNQDGSFATQDNRKRILSLCADQLYEMGFYVLHVSSLRPKHIEALVARWLAEGLSAGTIKNRMSALRWVAEKIGKQNIIRPSNRDYGILDRVFVTNVSKALTLGKEQLALVTCPYTAMSLRLQNAFGLRREESLKFIPAKADMGDKLLLVGSWTKGGKERVIPINRPGQRELLDEAKHLANGGSLIPQGRSYYRHLQVFKAQCDKAGISHVHGLRHLFAQREYEARTGWKCPAAGGPTRKQLKPAQRALDRLARFEIAAILGHGRGQVTVNYLGR